MLLGAVKFLSIGTELQIRGAIWANSKITFSYLSKKIYVVTPSLEPSQGDGSNDGTKHKF